MFFSFRVESLFRFGRFVFFSRVHENTKKKNLSVIIKLVRAQLLIDFSITFSHIFFLGFFFIFFYVIARLLTPTINTSPHKTSN